MAAGSGVAPEGTAAGTTGAPATAPAGGTGAVPVTGAVASTFTMAASCGWARRARIASGENRRASAASSVRSITIVFW